MRSLVVAGALVLAAATAAAKNPVVVFETTKGAITVELFADKAPISTKNMLDYVNAKLYDGTVFHRVIPGFMIQGGGFTKDLVEKPTRPAIKNEAKNGLSNKRGTLAMARTNVVDSATSQFFVSLVDNTRLDYKSDADVGYAVFGKVIEGMDVIDAIAKVERLCPSTPPIVPCQPGRLPPGMMDVPKEPVVVTKAYVKP